MAGKTFHIGKLMLRFDDRGVNFRLGDGKDRRIGLSRSAQPDAAQPYADNRGTASDSRFDGDYSDAAIVVFSRVGGEGSDMPTGDFGDGTKYLALQEQEKDVLREIQDSGKFDKVIALINTSNAMELGWVDQEEYGIDACIWIGGVGQSGARAVAKALCGEINPSGHLADTYAADSFSSPAMQNFGDFTFTNASEIEAQIGADNNGTKYVVYAEGIYVGYRYYETRYEDVVMGTGNAGDYDYASTVLYPFGYGLSYTQFQYSDFSMAENDDSFTVSVTVTNTGDTYTGKEVVQVYFQSPYTQYDMDNGVEKASVELCGFAKTDALAPR